MNTNLGRQGRDKITGFAGTITGHVDYITGCSQYLLTAPAADGKLTGSEWFDEQRVELSGNAIVLNNGATPGCDRAAPKR